MSFLDSVISGATEIAQKVGNQLVNTLDPTQARLSIAGLLTGGARRTKTATGTMSVSFQNAMDKGNAVPIEEDWRVRVSVGETSGIFYNSQNLGILAPLKDTKGVIFPYTPSITTSFTASYSPQKNTHSNYPAYFYEASEVAGINISGDFTVQTIEEGQYLLACIYFFRAASKMFYGSGQNAGNPPPILFLNGYGKEYFPNVPCVLTSFQHVMSSDVDYLEVPTLDNQGRGFYPGVAANTPSPTTSQGTAKTVRIPTISQIQISLQPVYSRSRVAEFDLEKFAQGKLLDKGFL